MIPRIDFFSYSVENYAPHFSAYEKLEGLNRDIWYTSVALLGVSTDSPDDEWQPVSPNKPYRKALQNRITKARIEWGNIDTVFIQCTGQTCEHLRQTGQLDNVIELHQPRATRIDFAADMLCTTTPREFVEARTHKKFRSVWDITEVTGDTVYVGSWSSDRFARVYRYNPPHDRSAWLRAEHVFKGKRARRAALAYLGKDLTEVLASCGVVWGWGHSSWVPDANPATVADLLKLWTPERKISKTLAWLEKQVAPAMAKVIAAGEIPDLEEWLRENVYNRLNNRDDGAPAAANNSEDKGQWQSEQSTNLHTPQDFSVSPS